MPTRSLTDIPSGSDVVLDANILIYALTGQSAECAGLLRRCSREEVTGICLFEIVNEATHRFMLAEAQSRGHIKQATARELRPKPEAIRTLVDYWTNAERILNLNLLFLPLDEEILRAAQITRQSAGLLTNDSMIASSMQMYGISYLASADGDFDRVAGITVFGPSDLAS